MGVFTISGFYFNVCILYHRTIKPIENWENKLPLSNASFESSEQTIKQFETERYTGILLLFILLNAMLVVFKYW